MVEGDDLIAIGERFSISVDALKEHNKLASDKIEIGQQLAIPGEAPATAAPDTSPKYKYSTAIPPGIEAPDSIQTRLGARHFVDGFPDESTAQTLYDNLDFQRAVQAFLLGMPAVSQVANRSAFADLGPANTVVPIFNQLLNARTLVLTGNDNTVYSWTWLDLSDGPIVLKLPPKVLGTANDMWQR